MCLKSSSVNKSDYFRAHHHSHEEHEDDSDDNHGPGIVYAKVEASQKDIQRGKDKGRSTHLIIQFVLILHSVQKWPF